MFKSFVPEIKLFVFVVETESKVKTSKQFKDINCTWSISITMSSKLTPMKSNSKRSRSRTLSVVAGSSHSTSYNLYKLLLKELGIDIRDQKVKAREDDDPDRNVGSVLINPRESLEQIMNMINLPFYLEKFMVFGLLSCLNSFLKMLVILPLKIIIDVSVLVIKFRNQFIIRENREGNVTFGWNYLNVINLKNLLFASLLLLAMVFSNVDTSRIYHTIKAQSSIKLYVMFGVLEISDKLLATVGQDLLNVLFSYNNVFLTDLGSISQFVLFYGLSLIYLTIHTVVLVYQTISLNVAANSYSNSLLTLLLSNQFAEIKGSVFKKIDREGLFQMSCADVVERFQLLTMLTIISLRNLVQIGNDSNNVGLLPNSSFASWNRVLGMIFGPTTIVIGSELIVDWVKHSYVTKFNRIRPRIYSKYLNVLSSDMIDNFKIRVSNNNDDKIQHRIGLPLPALFVLFIVMSKHSLVWFLFDETSGTSWTSQLIFTNLLILIFSYITLLLFKLLLELILIKWSNSRMKKVAMNQQQQDSLTPDTEEDYVPGFVSGGMGAIDTTSRKLVYEHHETMAPSLNEIRHRKDSKTHGNMSQVSRYRMFSKKIW